jgi:hypothetical protein
MRYPAKQNAFQNCKKRWERCIHSGGEYFWRRQVLLNCKLINKYF